MSEAKILLTATDQTKAAFESVKSSLAGLEERAGSLRGAFEGLAAGLGLASFAESVRDVIDYGDELGKLSQRTGIATTALSQLTFAAQQNGVSSESMTQAVKKLNVSMNEALAGNKTYTQAFANLGVQLKDATGKTISADQALLQIADRFSKANDGATKTAYAVALMGRAGDQLIPVLNKGSDGIEQLMSTADKLGITVGKDFSARADEFNTSLGMLKAQSEAWRMQLASELLPTMQAIVGELIEIRKASDATEHSLLGETLVKVFQTVASLGANVVYVLKETGIELGGIAAQVDAILSGNWGRVSQIHEEMMRDAGTARQAVDRSTLNILGVSSPNAGSGRGFVNPPGVVPTTTALPPVVNGAGDAAAAYEALIKRIQEKIDAENQELTQGKALTDFEKFAIKVRQDEAELLKKFPGLHQAEIDALLAKAAARDKDLQLVKAEQQNATNDAKYWEQTQKELTDDTVKRAAERDAVYKQIADHKLDLDDSNAMLQKEVSLLGASDQQRQIGLGYLQIELDTKRQIAKIDQDYLLNEEQRAKAKADINANADLQKQALTLRTQLDLWHSIDDTARQAFDNIGQKGSNIFKQLGDDLKKYLLDQLYQMEVRPYLMNFVANISGTGGAGGVPANPYAGGGMSSLGGLNMGSMTPNNFGLGNLFSSFGGGGGAGTAVDMGTATGADLSTFYGDSATLGSSAGSAAAGAGIGSTIGSAIPYVGALYAASQGKYGAAAGMAIGTMILPGIGTIIGAILGSLLDGKGGGPKQDGVYGTLASGIGQGQRSAASDAAAKTSATSIQSTYDSIVNAYGGTDSLKYGLGFSMDPKGTSPSFVDITATGANGGTAYTDLNLNAGRSQQELQDAVAGMTTKAVLAGLQQSNLHGIIGQYLAGLGDVATLSLDDATKALDRVQKALTEKQSLEDQIFQLTTSDADKLIKTRQDELAALDDSNKALEERVFSLQDEVTANNTLQQALASARSSAQAYATFLAGINTSIRGYLDKLNATPAGLLSPQDQLSNANTQFNQQLQLARAGDRTALQGITGYADQLIQAQVGYSATGGDTAAVIAAVKAQLAGLPQMQTTEQYLANVIQSTSSDQVTATAAAGDKVWDGLWGTAGLLSQQFKVLDTTTDGLLSFDELKAALGPLASDDTIHALIARVDTDGDGQISKLEAINASVAEAAAVQKQASEDAAGSLAATVTASTGALSKKIVDALAPVAGTLQYIAGSHDYTVVGNPLGGSVSGLFANGGVMTPNGPLPLRAYAAGGVANSPQLAIFGEGRTPEAYVPLPDGRSIPVKMQGSANARLEQRVDAVGKQLEIITQVLASYAQRALANGQSLVKSADATARAAAFERTKAPV